MARILRHFILTITCLFLARIASAHELPPVVADANIAGNALELSMELSLEELIIEMRIQLDGADPEAMAAEYDRLRQLEGDALAEEFAPYSEAFVQDFVILAGERQIAAEDYDLVIPDIGNVLEGRETIVKIHASLPDDNSSVQIGWGADNGDLVIRQFAETGEYIGYLVNGELSEPLPRSKAAEVGVWQSFKHYVYLGYIHIIPRGLDHILFVLGLFFFALAWRPLVWQVTTFTLAHSITLFMAALGWVSVPVNIVEPLIAASIIFVAIENVMTSEPKINRRRVFVIFGFGLLHGLGFASVLGDIGLDPINIVLSLIAFNIGIEFAQFIVIMGAFMIDASLFLANRIFKGEVMSIPDWYRPYIAKPASLIIASIAAYWLIERVF